MSSSAVTSVSRSGSVPVDPPTGRERPRLTGVARRRQVPYLLVGVLLVLGCGLGGVLVASQLGDREAVLVLARPVTVGQKISAGDLREVSLALDPGVEVIRAGALPDVAGQPVAYSLPAGTILSPEALGDPLVPPAGRAVTAVPLERGQFPPGLQPGSTVDIVAGQAEGTTAGGESWPGTSWTAVVTAIEDTGDGQKAVATVQLDVEDAQAMAAWPTEDLHLVVVAGSAS
ncbi:flagellar biosynthesis protein FlgA [Streptomyces sp. 3MP-14]|uniref:Flagellar biosynthesis protein FlgA n=1 Tax=Streptomyces mimosae TaxID=2586635 RepID=A0A5N6ACP4_9ACTN|nr:MULTISPECIES: SAF domain-containing protein [Streptomyces]KAB8166431.1 flagellar biosynthesis protein FlgA [Streptomyces mimosae]KAB8178861.1 flagellar biosynthesis protein FlgA [Streptomyces sp. 3MP-14]